MRMRSGVVLGCLLLTGCATTAFGTVEKGVASVLISPQQENKLGLEFKQDLEQKEHVVYLNDPAVVSYVRAVANKVIAPAKRERPEVTWQVNVIDDPKTVNAFATPGGFLYVYTGLLLAAGNEAELAGVMAHEAGHVVARHSARQMVDAYGLQAITALALGKNPNLLAALGANVAAKGFMLANSRSDETEADEYGARFAAAAGYDPNALITFFQKLLQQEGHTPRILAFLSDHPTTPDRIAHLKAYLQQHHLRGDQLNIPQFTSMKQRLTTRAPSPSKGRSPSM